MSAPQEKSQQWWQDYQASTKLKRRQNRFSFADLDSDEEDPEYEHLLHDLDDIIDGETRETRKREFHRNISHDDEKKPFCILFPDNYKSPIPPTLPDKYKADKTMHASKNIQPHDKESNTSKQNLTEVSFNKTLEVSTVEATKESTIISIELSKKLQSEVCKEVSTAAGEENPNEVKNNVLKPAEEAAKKAAEVVSVKKASEEEAAKKAAEEKAAKKASEEEEARKEDEEEAAKNAAERGAAIKAAEEEAVRKAAEEEAAKKAAEEEAAKKASEEESAKKAAEEAAKKAAEEEAARQATEEEASRKAAEEEAVRKAAEEEAAKKAAEEEATKKAAEEEAAKKANEEAAKKAAEEEAVRKAVEEEAARKVAEEEASKKAAEEEAAKKASEEEAAKKAAEEAAEKAAEEEAARKTAEEEAARKAAEEEAAKKAAEEEAAKKAAEEEAAKKAAEEAAEKAAEEEAARKTAEKEAARKAAEEEAAKKAAEEEAAKKAAEEEAVKKNAEEAAKKAAEEEVARKVAEEETAKKAAEEEAAKKAAEEEAAKKAAEEAAKKAAEEEAARKVAEEEAAKKASEEEAAKKAAEEAAKKAAEEEAARKAAEEEAARKAAEEEAAKKAAEEEAAKKAIEEEAAKKATDKAAKKAAEEKAARKAAEEESAKKAAEEVVSRKAAEGEAAKKAAEEAAKQAAEEEAAKQATEKEAARKAVQEEAAKKAADDEEAKIASDEEAAIKATKEEAARKAAEEEAEKNAAEEGAVKKAAKEEAAKKAAEENSVKKADKEEGVKKIAKEEASKKAAEEEAAKIYPVEEATKKDATGEAAKKAAEKEATRKAAEEEAASSSVSTELSTKVLKEESTKASRDVSIEASTGASGATDTSMATSYKNKAFLLAKESKIAASTVDNKIQGNDDNKKEINLRKGSLESNEESEKKSTLKGSSLDSKIKISQKEETVSIKKKEVEEEPKEEFYDFLFGSKRRRKTTNVTPKPAQDTSGEQNKESVVVVVEQENQSKSSFCWAEHVEEIAALESLEKELVSSVNEDDRKRAEELNNLLSSVQKVTGVNLSKADDCTKVDVVESESLRCSSAMEMQEEKDSENIIEKDTKGNLEILEVSKDKLGVENPQLFEDANSELDNDPSNPMFVEKDVDSISIESFESCAETVIYVNEAATAEGVEEIEIDRPCSKTELIIIDDIKAHYDMEEVMLNSYQIDYTPEIIESIQLQFQNSLIVDNKNKKGESTKIVDDASATNNIKKKADQKEENKIAEKIQEYLSEENKPIEVVVKASTKDVDIAVETNIINTEHKESSKITIDENKEEAVKDDKLSKEKNQNKDFKIEDNNKNPSLISEESKLKEKTFTSTPKTESKSPCKAIPNTIIENFKRNLQFISSHPKFSNLHAQTMKLLSCELSKNVDSEILKAKLIKKELGYLVKELEERELGFLFFDGLDEKSIDITKEEMLSNINSNLSEIKQSSEFSTSKIIKANVALVENIIANEKDKYAIFQKLKDHNLHSIALRNVGVKIVRIFSAQGSECVEIICQPPLVKNQRHQSKTKRSVSRSTEGEQIVVPTEDKQILVPYKQILVPAEKEQVSASSKVKKISVSTEEKQISVPSEEKQIFVPAEVKQISVPAEIEQVSVAPELEQIAQPIEVKRIAVPAVKDVKDKDDIQGIQAYESSSNQTCLQENNTFSDTLKPEGNSLNKTQRFSAEREKYETLLNNINFNIQQILNSDHFHANFRLQAVVKNVLGILSTSSDMIQVIRNLRDMNMESVAERISDIDAFIRHSTVDIYNDPNLIEIINENIDSQQNDPTFPSNETMQRKVNIVTQILLGSSTVNEVVDKLQLQGLQYFAVRKKQGTRRSRTKKQRSKAQDKSSIVQKILNQVGGNSSSDFGISDSTDVGVSDDCSATPTTSSLSTTIASTVSPSASPLPITTATQLPLTTPLPPSRSPTPPPPPITECKIQRGRSSRKSKKFGKCSGDASEPIYASVEKKNKSSLDRQAESQQDQDPKATDTKDSNKDNINVNNKAATIEVVKEKDNSQIKTVDNIVSVIKDTKTSIVSSHIVTTETVSEDKSAKDKEECTKDDLTVSQVSSSIVSRILNENTTMNMTSSDHESRKENVRESSIRSGTISRRERTESGCSDTIPDLCPIQDSQKLSEDVCEGVPEILVNTTEHAPGDENSLSKCGSGADLFFLTNVDPEGTTPGLLSPQPQSQYDDNMLGSLLQDVESRVMVSLDNLLLTSHIDPLIVLNKEDFVHQTVDEIKWSIMKYSEYSMSTMSIDSDEEGSMAHDPARAFQSSMKQLDYIENQFRGLKLQPGDYIQSLPATPGSSRHPPRSQTAAAGCQQPGDILGGHSALHQIQATSLPQAMDAAVNDRKLDLIRALVNSPEVSTEDKVEQIRHLFNTTS